MESMKFYLPNFTSDKKDDSIYRTLYKTPEDYTIEDVEEYNMLMEKDFITVEEGLTILAMDYGKISEFFTLICKCKDHEVFNVNIPMMMTNKVKCDDLDIPDILKYLCHDKVMNFTNQNIFYYMDDHRFSTECHIECYIEKLDMFDFVSKVEEFLIQYSKDSDAEYFKNTDNRLSFKLDHVLNVLELTTFDSRTIVGQLRSDEVTDGNVVKIFYDTNMSISNFYEVSYKSLDDSIKGDVVMYDTYEDVIEDPHKYRSSIFSRKCFTELFDETIINSLIITGIKQISIVDFVFRLTDEDQIYMCILNKMNRDVKAINYIDLLPMIRSICCIERYGGE